MGKSQFIMRVGSCRLASLETVSERSALTVSYPVRPGGARIRCAQPSRTPAGGPLLGVTRRMPVLSPETKWLRNVMGYLIVWVFLLGLSCTRVEVSSPEEVYREFYQALAEKDWDRALGYLSHDAQDAIVRQRTFLHKAIEGDELRSAFFPTPRAEVLVPLRSIDVISREADGVTIEVHAGSGDQNEPYVSNVKLRLEGGRYVIAPQLPASLIESGQEGT